MSEDEGLLIVEAQEYAVMQESLPLLNDLQLAIKAAMEAEEPLADACYRADTLDTIRELTAHFRGQARLLNRRERP